MNRKQAYANVIEKQNQTCCKLCIWLISFSIVYSLAGEQNKPHQSGQPLAKVAKMTAQVCVVMFSYVFMNIKLFESVGTLTLQKVVANWRLRVEVPHWRSVRRGQNSGRRCGWGPNGCCGRGICCCWPWLRRTIIVWIRATKTTLSIHLGFIITSRLRKMASLWSQGLQRDLQVLEHSRLY